MINFMDKLKAARQSELAIQAETEHIERLHRIAKLPGRPLEYSIKIAEKLAKLEKRLNASIDLAVDRKNGRSICLTIFRETNARFFISITYSPRTGGRSRRPCT